MSFGKGSASDTSGVVGNGSDLAGAGAWHASL